MFQLRKISITLIVLIIFTSCNSEKKFDSEKWIPFEDGVYGKNYRKLMINDLVNNVLKFDTNKSNGTSRSEVYKLIDKPDGLVDDSEIYLIQEKNGQIDPNGYIKLHLKYSKNSTLYYWKIEDVTYKE